MWAFLKVLERMLPPGRVYTDHKGILEGLQKGERWCTLEATTCGSMAKDLAQGEGPGSGCTMRESREGPQVQGLDPAARGRRPEDCEGQ
eukprot:4398516-Pyramimonas_sp.AAC.1